MADPVPVLQEDREAAADVWRDFVAKIGECMAEKALRAGQMDDSLLVLAFARHRQSGVAEGLRQAAVIAEDTPSPWDGDDIARHAHCVEAGNWSNGCDAAATAIRSRISELHRADKGEG